MARKRPVPSPQSGRDCHGGSGQRKTLPPGDAIESPHPARAPGRLSAPQMQKPRPKGRGFVVRMVRRGSAAIDVEDLAGLVETEHDALRVVFLRLEPAPFDDVDRTRDAERRDHRSGLAKRRDVIGGVAGVGLALLERAFGDRRRHVRRRHRLGRLLPGRGLTGGEEHRTGGYDGNSKQHVAPIACVDGQIGSVCPLYTARKRR
ncbi:hypothetical protein SDC9_34458 [bioreactor metagenome]|uniref:Uncharacterized protein n=1 Tax=bioreactor metagenome TaxID=1076179 RepID=A0A644VBF8_9ZZZZ